MSDAQLGWWRRLWTKAAAPLTAVFARGGSYSRRRWTYAIAVAEGYERNPYVFRGVNLVSQAVGSLDWQTFRRTAKGYQVEPETHPLTRLLMRPNPLTGGSAFFQAIVSHLLLGGRAYVIKVRPQPGLPPRELHAVAPDTMKRVDGSKLGEVLRYDYQPDPMRRPIPYEPRDVICISLFSASRLDGFSPLSAAAVDVDQLNSAAEWNARLMKNGGAPEGAWVVQGVLDKEAHAKAKRLISDEVGGIKNAGNLPLLSGDIKYERYGLSPKELQYERLIMVCARGVALALDVPPKLMFDADTQNYASLSAAMKQLWLEAALPKMALVRDELNAQLAPDFGDDIVTDTDLDAVEALSEGRADKWKRVNDAVALTLNEKRAELGLEPLGKDGDVILVPSSSVTLGDVIDPGGGE